MKWYTTISNLTTIFHIHGLLQLLIFFSWIGNKKTNAETNIFLFVSVALFSKTILRKSIMFQQTVIPFIKKR